MTWAAKPSLPALHKLTATELRAITDEIERVGNVFVADAVLGASSAGIGATETVVLSVTFTATAAVRYQVIGGLQLQASGAGDFFVVRARWAAGATVTTAGTQIVARGVSPASAGSFSFHLARGFSPGVTGQVTAGITLQRTAGAGTIVLAGGANADSLVEIERRS